MAHALIDKNLVSPAGQPASAATFIDPYTYNMQFQPELFKIFSTGEYG